MNYGDVVRSARALGAVHSAPGEDRFPRQGLPSAGPRERVRQLLLPNKAPLQIWSWGSPVYYDDEVTIVSHQMNMNLHGSRSKFYSSPMSTVASNDVVESTDGLGSPLPFSLQSPRQREVNGSRDFYSFQITFYQRDNGTDSELRTQAGFRLFHPEADSFMQASGSACKNGMRVDGKTWAHVPYLKSIDGMAAVPTIVEGRVDPNLNIKGTLHMLRGIRKLFGKMNSFVQPPPPDSLWSCETFTEDEAAPYRSTHR